MDTGLLDPFGFSGMIDFQSHGSCSYDQTHLTLTSLWLPEPYLNKSQEMIIALRKSQVEEQAISHLYWYWIVLIPYLSEQ